MLVVGDSYAVHLPRRCSPHLAVAAAGVRGGCVNDDGFRRWAIRAAVRARPRVVTLVAGGNDLARRDCRVQRWLANLQELTLGLLAAGVVRVYVLPIPPRTGFPSSGVSARIFRRRRWVANKLLRRLFRQPPVLLLHFVPPPDFLASDGVHPSAAGWRTLESVLQEAMDASSGI
ncbi:hypothetical protein FJT64_015121 [Amphibalanus amphitrite]|uniref:SGNH hydrolase-type esterase domain-containing protein n=1 Tax=Amphibalanus amphitrite TaxID=1232801 RepID=A0A6A4XEF7_AMPAM|nr:hypothetical protein FJT64_007026 [Amphibalanus amphitrite]KAF0295476.1 hypothetical protein FJT64_007032 [Amphibalanus amphitrite]KAF0296040.1 hypothetical protein FJT64_006504 [Amphibalanus amphitrite]KAF0296942.1 hypothetical protein FJT64_005682 [Amphibalanus amphitrite]KAF0297490.1 hypothetical protein FJT64_005052 [Amphibalanus amphitrite]